MLDLKICLLICFFISMPVLLSSSYDQNEFLVAISGQKHRGEGFMEGFTGQSASSSNKANQSIQVGDVISIEEGDYKATQTITLSAPDIRFDFDSYDVGSIFESQISGFVDVLHQNAAAKVLLEGHTDWIGTDAYNLSLSLKRANAVRDKLMEFGINKSRISIEAYGKSRPIASNATAEGRAQNRRVEMIIVEPIKR